MDWQEWHDQYDDPGSSLARRLATVREHLARILAERRGRPTQLVSLCAGDGRDVLPVLAAGHREVAAVLVELDPGLATAARAAAAASDLDRVKVRTGDAGLVSTLESVPPADILMLCGVFGNVSDADVGRTIGAIPQMVSTDARIIWTRGSRSKSDDPSGFGGDPSEMVRSTFGDAGLAEEAFIRPDDAGFRVGVHRFTGRVPTARLTGPRLFRFVR